MEGARAFQFKCPCELLTKHRKKLDRLVLQRSTEILESFRSPDTWMDRARMVLVLPVEHNNMLAFD